METTNSSRPRTPGRGRQLRRLPAPVRRAPLRLLVPPSVRPQRGRPQRRRHLLPPGRGGGRRHAPEAPALPAVPPEHGHVGNPRTERPPRVARREQLAELAVQLLLEPGDGGPRAPVAQPAGAASGPRLARHRRQKVAQ